MSITTSKKNELFNKLIVFIAVISLTLGMLAFYVTQYLPQFYVELFIGVTFLALPYLDKVMNFQIRMVFAYAILCAALVFYGIILGMIAEIHILVAFLVGSAYLFLSGKIARTFAFSYVGLMLVFLEMSYYYRWFSPLRLDYQSQMIIRWIVVSTGCALDAIVVYFLFKHWSSDRNSRLTAELKRSNELKSVYVRETTHELRAPITTLYYITEILYKADANASIEDYRIFIEDAYATVSQTIDICDNVLQLSKMEEGILDKQNLSTFLFTEWLAKNVKINQYRANNRFIKIEVLPFPDGFPKRIVSDLGKLNQILNNILTNAIKYSNQNSTVKVSVKWPNTKEWVLEIEDQGAGISKENIGQVFLPFFTEGSGYESTGLGLPITKRLVENLGGRIDIESTINEGTTVIMRFPLIQSEKNCDYTTKLKQLPLLDFLDKTLLIIDDDNLQMKYVQMMLKTCFKTILSANNGIDGLKLAIERQPDIIVLDANMPQMSGKEVLEQLKQDPKTNAITVLIVSADTNIEFQNEMFVCGATDFITKPYKEEVIKEKLRNMANHQRVADHRQ